MKFLAIFLIVLSGSVTWAQEGSSYVPTPSATLTVPLTGKWNSAKVPWDEWFKNNALVTDKTDHVHFFWNAQDFKANFEVKDKKKRLADAALQLVSRLYPVGAKSDLMKVDIVYVLERDNYGMPKWDSLQQIAHLEFSRAKAAKAVKSKATLSAAMGKIFDKFEVF